MTTTHRITIGIVLALAIGAVPAAARQIDLTANGSEVPAGALSTQTTTRETTNAATPFVQAASARVAHQLAARDTARHSAIVSTSPAIVRVTAGDSGFDWGDAAVGAAVGIALSVIGLGGTLAVSRRRGRRTRPTTAALTN